MHLHDDCQKYSSIQLVALLYSSFYLSISIVSTRSFTFMYSIMQFFLSSLWLQLKASMKLTICDKNQLWYQSLRLLCSSQENAFFYYLLRGSLSYLETQEMRCFRQGTIFSYSDISYYGLHSSICQYYRCSYCQHSSYLSQKGTGWVSSVESQEFCRDSSATQSLLQLSWSCRYELGVELGNQLLFEAQISQTSLEIVLLLFILYQLFSQVGGKYSRGESLDYSFLLESVFFTDYRFFFKTFFACLRVRGFYQRSFIFLRCLLWFFPSSVIFLLYFFYP